MTAIVDDAPRAVRRSDRSELTENEIAWLYFWRSITEGRDPPISLRVVQLVQRLVRHGVNR